ncbi:MAG: stage II sporulation protein M [Terriglobales bacterium]
MNVERWLKARTPYWHKLEALLRQVDSKGLGCLDRTELQELGRLYRSASADLSRARALKLSQDVQVYLNNVVVKAHNQVYQTRRNRWMDLVNFLWFGFPELVRKNILYVALGFTLCVVPGMIGYTCEVQDVHFAQMEMLKGHPLVSEELWSIIEQHKMWTDQLETSSAPMAGVIATNNIRVAIMAFVLGITFGIGTAIVLIMNGLSIGTVFGICKDYGMSWKLLAFVAPHGVIELSTIFISGGAGLLIAKALLFPGQYKRIDSFKLIAREAGGLFAGCAPLLLVAGSIEGFISPRTDLDPNIKFAVSLATAICLVLYLFVPRHKKSA